MRTALMLLFLGLVSHACATPDREPLRQPSSTRTASDDLARRPASTNEPTTAGESNAAPGSNAEGGDGDADDLAGDAGMSVAERSTVLGRQLSPRVLPSRPLPDDAAWADHFITYTEDAVDSVMARYRRAGFITSPPERTVRHEPGLRNGFVYVGPEYLEFCWVEREDEFREQVAVEPYYATLRSEHRPFGIGFQVLEPENFRARLVESGLEMPDVLFARPQDAPIDSEPRWAYGMFPDGTTPGAHAFYLSYLGRDGQRRNENFFVGENGIFLIVGAVLVSPMPRTRLQQWSSHLLGSEQSDARDSRGVAYGPHAYIWITPAEWNRLSGAPYPDPPAEFQELSAVVALSFDLERTERFLESASFPFQRSTIDLPVFGRHEGLFLFPDPRDGFPMLILEGAVQDWKAWRDGVSRREHRIRRSLETQD